MDAKEKVLVTMKEAGQPLNAGKIAELSGLDRKERWAICSGTSSVPLLMKNRCSIMVDAH